MKLRLRRSPSASSVPLTRRALIDLLMVTAFVWIAVFTIHKLDLPAGLSEWNATHQNWAIDEFTLVSLCVAVALGIFSWRRWQESVRTIARYQKTLDQLHSTESQIASRDDLIRSVSHELRTPLTAVLGYAELLGSTGLDSPERTEIVDTIIREGRDLSNIVEDLITRARSEAATLEVGLVRVSMAGQAAQVLESRSPEDRERIGRRLDPGAFATGDPARVRQILRNLLSNALKYGEGEVEISAIADGDTVGLSVSNRGEEIPESDREKIFDPYHRVQGNGPKPGGLGLGLAISRELARLMGGDLAYRYESGRSFFDLSLPRFEEIRGEPAAPDAAQDTFDEFDTPTEDIPNLPTTPLGAEEISPEPPAAAWETDAPDGFEPPAAAISITPQEPIGVEEIPDEPTAPARPEETPDTFDTPAEDVPIVPQGPAGHETTATSDHPGGIEEASNAPQPPWTAENLHEPEPPIRIEQIPEAPEASAWMEVIPDAPEAPRWIEEIPHSPPAPTWADEIRDLSQPPPWMDGTPDRPEAAIEPEDARDAAEAPVRVGEGPFDFLGYEGQDQRL